jgi:nitrate/nitrite-specific signal transduction histidine kinase
VRDGEEETEVRGEAVLSIFRRGADFMKQILAENEALREELREVRHRQHEAAQSPEQWEGLRLELRDRIEQLEDENKTILEQLKAVESENHQFAERYVEIEEENNYLANLYVASYQLHCTLEPNEVFKVILEIVINLIGAEVFCVYAYDEKTRQFRVMASEGAPLSAFPEVRVGEGALGRSVASGEVVAGDPAAGGTSPGSGEPLICIPLRVEDEPAGAIAIYQLLQQKDGFSSLDRELFSLLAGHAATAILASKLYSQSERKLSTIQGFIDLLTK